MSFSLRLPLFSLLVIGVTACDAKTTEAEPPAQASAADQSPDSKPDSATAAEIVIALDGEGLRFVNSETGSTRLLAFGRDRDAVETAIAAQLGAVEGRSSNEECGAGPIDFSNYGDFTANFQDGDFVGWSLSGGDKNAALTTISGVGIGTKRSEMAKSVTFEMYDESTIGTEFHTGGDEAGGFSGLLDSDTPDAKITDLWAGTNCIFR
ncbi:MAG: hypothetical protein GW808_14420 [Sphingomonadales bacterium]|nr:hypothetical protein [Sphingomonadales bacterium]PIX64165.1 MAG: hypothetical protein COZ43_12490 [Sphingomonadales bacterium CG_4_10_14_3_um_filter_58_15]NCO50378.1 hypothetical protein [Sphingomonadales bacterium]NCO98665.1 hypothetical protein [Sphingomonadales bacterium]NCP26752.1 hypothetical protein [Sphingomonadales bacterium]